MLIFLLGLRPGEDGEIVPLSLMVGQREVMHKLLTHVSERTAEKRAAADPEFDHVAEQIRRQAMGESVTPGVEKIAKLLTDDHTELERTAGWRTYLRKLQQAGVGTRAPEPAREAPPDDTADRERAGLPAAPPAAAPSNTDVVRLRPPAAEGGLVFDEDVAAVYRGGPRRSSMDDPRLAIELEQHRQRAARARTPEDAAWAAGLDPATAPLGQIAAVARAAALGHSDRVPASAAPSVPSVRDPLDDAPPEVP